MKNYRPLNENEQICLCEFIRLFVPVARTAAHPMLRDLARRQIALTLWRWTADAVETGENVLRQNAYKYNVEYHPATSDAIKLIAVGDTRNLRHEHVVPRMWLARRIVDGDFSVGQIHGLLTRCCRAVIVTTAEDRLLRPRNAMPDEWSLEVGNPYERYILSKLISRVQNLPAEWQSA